MKKIYHGWWIALTCTLLMALAFAPGMNLTGVFVKPIAEDFGVSRTAVTTQVTFYTVASMLLSPFVGFFLKKVKIKLLMSIFTFVLGVCYVLRFFTTSIPQLYILSAISGIAIVLITSIPVSILINNWFGPKMRGKVMGIVMAGTGIGATVLNPILSYINTTAGWRYSYLLIGAIILILLLPLVILTIVRAPEDIGAEPLGYDSLAAAVPMTSGYMMKDAIKTSMFWCLGIVFLFFAISGSLFTTNSLAYLSDIGFSEIDASLMISASSAALMLSKIALGALCDRFGVKKSALSVASLIIVGAIMLIISGQFTPLALPSVIIFCIGTAVPTVTMAMMTMEIFGYKDYSTIFSLISLFSNMGISIGPVLGSLIFDTTQSYTIAWIIDAILASVLVILIWYVYRQRKLKGLPE